MAHFLIIFFWSGEGTGVGAKFALAFPGALIFQIFSLPKYYYCVRTNFLPFRTLGGGGGGGTIFVQNNIF
jgi:hypothetical protein